LYESPDVVLAFAQIRTHFDKIHLSQALDIFSATGTYTFVPVGAVVTQRYPNTFNNMLFLGENDNEQYWATMRMHAVKPNEVITYKISKDSAVATHITATKALCLMGPLQILGQNRTKHTNDQLKTFVKYLFMKNDSHCVAIKPGTNLHTLEAAVKSMSTAYGQKQSMFT
jgi:hypothetical protein